MKWLLVVIVANTPVKTDLVFDSLRSCLAAETEMRAEWAAEYNSVASSGASKETLEMLRTQMIQGTCVPTKAEVLGDDNS